MFSSSLTLELSCMMKLKMALGAAVAKECLLNRTTHKMWDVLQVAHIGWVEEAELLE